MTDSLGLSVAAVIGGAAAAQSLVWMVVTSLIGRAFALEVRSAQFGWIRLFSIGIGGVPVGVGLLPFGSSVAFAGNDTDPGDAGPGRRDWRDTPVAIRGLLVVLSWVLAASVASVVLGLEALPAFGRAFPQLLSAVTGEGSRLAAELVRRTAAGLDVTLVALIAVKLCALNALGTGVHHVALLLRRGPQGEQVAVWAYFFVFWGLSAAWGFLIARAV